MRFDFILIVHLLPSFCGFFVFGHGISFFGGFQHSSVNGCSRAGCDFGVLAGGYECVSFYSAILNWKSLEIKCILYVDLLSSDFA